VHSLVQSGASINRVTSDTGMSALWSACEQGHLNVAQLLVRSGASINQGDNVNGRTPGDAAASNGHVDVVQFIQECIGLGDPPLKKPRLRN